MQWKEFFKPNKSKWIILGIIFIYGIIAFFVSVSHMCFRKCISECSYTLSERIICGFFSVTLYPIISFAPVTYLIGKINIIPQNIFFNLIAIIIGVFVNILVVWSLVCIVYWLYGKIKNSFQNNK